MPQPRGEGRQLQQRAAGWPLSSPAAQFGRIRFRRPLIPGPRGARRRRVSARGERSRSKARWRQDKGLGGGTCHPPWQPALPPPLPSPQEREGIAFCTNPLIRSPRSTRFNQSPGERLARATPTFNASPAQGCASLTFPLVGGWQPKGDQCYFRTSSGRKNRPSVASGNANFADRCRPIPEIFLMSVCRALSHERTAHS